ncbi:MAG: hypothetical protein IPM29_23640 [Planctomycetes bacterium]|nr:hypothetical protein [Planctomycetota bacterium]
MTHRRSTSRFPLRARFPLAGLLLVGLLLVGLAACGSNNIGALWDPNRGGSNDASSIVAVPIGGSTVDRRPRVVDAFPSSGGWPTTVPIAVLFSESMSQSSVAPASSGGLPGQGGGATAAVFIRVQGTTQALPGTNSLLAGGTLVVIRPLSALAGDVTYEICVAPTALDVDGLSYGGSEPDVVGTFRADRAASIEDGQIVTTIPTDNSRGVRRSSELFVLFDSPPNEATVTPASLRVETASGIVAGELDLPLQTAGIGDPRVFRFVPDDLLAGELEHRVVVDDTITFGNAGGKLDFGNRTPFARFTTASHGPATRVAIGNAAAGFPDKINASNAANAVIDIDVDASVPARANVVVRVYGLDPRTQAEDDLRYLELRAQTTVAGPTTVSVPFGSALGSPGRYAFGEGALTLRADVVVGGVSAGYVGSAAGSQPEFDVTPPTIIELLPAVPGSSTDVATDLETIVVHGRASEALGSGELSAAGATEPLFAASSDGRFVFESLTIGRGNVPVPYTMAVVDSAGNMAAMPVSGNILPRGAVLGTLADTLTVEIYHEVTLEPLQGVTVVVDPGAPAKPAVGQRIATTGTDGRATISGLTAGPHAVTAIGAGYDLVTLLGAEAAFVSLPLRPTTQDAATATLRATTAFVPTSGATALLGANTWDDRRTEAVQSASGAATMPPASRVRAGRPIVITAFSGVFPPTASPTFGSYACQMCGADLNTATPPTFGPTAGATVETTLALVPATGQVIDVVGNYSLDFAAAAGFGTLDGAPTVRVVASLGGFAGSALAGVGFATSTAGAAWSIRAGYPLPIFLGLEEFAPVLWVSTQARDSAGAIARHRRLISDPQLGLSFPTVPNPPGIPVVTAPSGASTGAPRVEFQDVLDPAALLGGQGFRTIVAVDPGARVWRVFARDVDGAVGAKAVQLPDLSGAMATGLATGAWSVWVEDELEFSLTATATSFHLEERSRNQVTFARSPAITFNVQ